jgi:signal transduction histidine kinase
MADVLTGEPLRHFRHELRTPLNHIIGFADVLIDDAEDAGRESLLVSLRQIRTAGMGLLESMQTALPPEMDSLDGAQLAQVAETLQPRIAQLLASCSVLEQSGAYGDGGESLEHLRTIAWALGEMTNILARGIG